VIEYRFTQQFRRLSEVMVQTSNESKDIVDNNPFQNQSMKESKWVVVMFLATRPDSRAQEDLEKTYVSPEELCIIGKEVYIYYPNGIGRSKLSNTFLEKKLKIAGTGRNWNTILQLQKLIQR